MFEDLKKEYRESLKSSDTEEHVDLAFYRPIGFAWACLFRKLGVSPNVVTIASIFIGVAAGICFYPVSLPINILGIILLIWANSYDSADGQLARLTRQYSNLGRILDGLAGDLWFVSIYVAISLRTMQTPGLFGEYPWLIWVIAILAGVCHAKQAAMADRYRQFHLYLVKGTLGSEFESADDVRSRLSALSWRKDFFNKVVLTSYYYYTKSQEQSTPQLRVAIDAIRSKYPDMALPADKAEEFRRWSFPLCKWENFMTFNWRSFFLFASILIGLPWVYFVAELTVFNLVLWMTIRRHETICRRIVACL